MITDYKDKHEYVNHNGTKSVIYLMDCMEAMKQIPDKCFQLAICDPPYGIGVNNNMGRRKGDKKSNYKPADWDKVSIKKECIDLMFSVSQNQIIFGANHFISKMPYDSSCWILWDKQFSEEVTFAQFELAWTSFKTSCKKFDMFPNTGEKRIHPTQKPVALYSWLLKNYAKPGDKILDTHVGSGSSRIACDKLDFDFTGFEIDEEYFNKSVERFENFVSQLRIF